MQTKRSGYFTQIWESPDSLFWGNDQCLIGLYHTNWIGRVDEIIEKRALVLKRGCV